MKEQKIKVALLIIFFLFIGSTYFTNQLLHQGNHTIAQNGEWSSLKLTDRLVLMGVQEFFEQRQAFAFNRLNLAELNRIHKIKTVFILEARDKEADSTSIKSLHQKMSQIGKAYNIPVSDLMGYVNSPEIYDSGLIWFDEVHMDRYGHKLIGKWLAEKLAPVIMGLRAKGE